MLKKYRTGIIIGGIILGALGVWSGYAVTQKDSHQDMVHYHAGFQIYEDGELLDFSDVEYMYLGSCGDMGKEGSIKDQVHLHDEIGDVVHVHSSEVTWADLITSLEIKAEITGFSLDGESFPVDLSQGIEPYQSAVIVIGEGNIEDLDDSRVTEEYIRTVEAETISCS